MCICRLIIKIQNLLNKLCSERTCDRQRNIDVLK